MSRHANGSKEKFQISRFYVHVSAFLVENDCFRGKNGHNPIFENTADRMQNTEGRILYSDLCCLSSAKEHIKNLDDSNLLLVRFRIGGSLRFLSHAETLRVFQRACVRADIPIQYTQGFNPHPKMTLPLPRPVGVESDDELLCIRVSCTSNEQQAVDYETQIKTQLSEQLPEGLELLSVSVTKAGRSFLPGSATYVLPVRREYLTSDLKRRIKHILASESLPIERKTGPENLKFKTLDVRGFLKSIELEDGCIIVQCKISPAGSIRVEEILQLLELDVAKLSAPLRRTSVQWNNS